MQCEFKNQGDKLTSLEQKIDMKFSLYSEKIDNLDKRVTENEKGQQWLWRTVFSSILTIILTGILQIKVK
jgi:uncharacterized protein YdcH (DUF465 family)